MHHITHVAGVCQISIGEFLKTQTQSSVPRNPLTPFTDVQRAFFSLRMAHSGPLLVSTLSVSPYLPDTTPLNGPGSCPTV